MSFKDTVWWTRKARIQAAKRLQSNDFASQLILLWYSSFTVCMSIYELKKPTDSGDFAIVMVILSVLILCASLYISNRNFKERAVSLKNCYEHLSELEGTLRNPSCNLIQANSDYKTILGSSENHEDIDFKSALMNEWLNTSKKDLGTLTRVPTIPNVIEVIAFTFGKYLILTAFVGLPFLTLLVR